MRDWGHHINPGIRVDGGFSETGRSWQRGTDVSSAAVDQSGLDRQLFPC